MDQALLVEFVAVVMRPVQDGFDMLLHHPDARARERLDLGTDMSEQRLDIAPADVVTWRIVKDRPD